MAEVRDPSHLTPRDREILKDVIMTYVLSAEPVSSRSVSKHGRLGLSAATIRNVMADPEEWGDLIQPPPSPRTAMAAREEWGSLIQPHTSAGRVPTAAAYHLFIESMMQARKVSARERRHTEESLRPGDADQLMENASHLLSELSHQVGIVMTPAVGETVLKAVEFVPSSGQIG